MATAADPEPQLVLSPEVMSIWPGLRLLGLRFESAHIGVGHRGLDLLRRRVFAIVRREVLARGSVEDLPEVGVFAKIPKAAGWDPDRDEPIHAKVMRLVAERRPFPVRNDAEDAGGLLGLFHRLPSFTFDADELRLPLTLALGRSGQTLPSPLGPRPVAGHPLLLDRAGPIASLGDGVLRSGPGEKARNLLVLLLDPGLDGGLELRDVTRRAANWMETLTGARLTASVIAP